MLRNVSGANFQLVRGSCAGIIPERVMNVQVDVYSINKQTCISRLDLHRLTQPLKFKDPSATPSLYGLHIILDMICWNMICLYWIHHLRVSRHPRVLIKLIEDMFNFLKINKKTSWLTWLHLKLFLQCSSEKLLIKSYLLIVFYFFPHVLVYSHSCQWSVGTVKHVQSVPALTNIPEQS